jgi:predicted permease
MWTSLQQMLARLRAFFSVSDLDRELDAELESHLAMLTDENIRRGMTPAEARRAAHLRLGARESTKELHREVRGLPFLETLMQDLRYTFRTLRRDAAFAVFAIVIAGLGIGASCTIFSVVNTLLLRPLPFRDPAALVWVKNHKDVDEKDLSGQTTQLDYVRDLRRTSQSFSALGAYMPFYGIGDRLLIGTGQPERLTDVGVTDNFFDLLGVTPLLGRNFNAQEALGKDHVAILSYNLWRRRFASDLHIVGKAIRLDSDLVTVIGVLPPSFDFGDVFVPGTRVDLFSVFPLTDETNKWGNTLALIGRLNPGVTLNSAQYETAALAAQMRKDDPKRNDFAPFLVPLAQHISGNVRPALILLGCAVGVVMLIVCANLSNLLLARGAARQKEIAIRSALGATKGRLIRQMLTESVVLSCCGAILGLFLAVLGTRALAQLSGVSIPLLGSVHVDAASLGFTAVFAVVTGLVFGLMPALQVPSNHLNDSLQDSARGSSVGRRHAWVRNVIVVSEIALACVLVVGAGLLIHSFLRVLDVDLGFRPEHAVTLRVDPTGPSYDTEEERNAYFIQAVHSALDIPGISAAGLTDALPYGSNRTWAAPAKGVQYTPQTFPLSFVAIVSPGYFQAMGIPLRSGREFTEADGPKTQKVILMNETLAQNLWPGQEPLGKEMANGAVVIGIVGNTRHLALEKDSGSEMYYDMLQTGDYSSVNLVMRTTLPNGVLSAKIREALAPIAPDLATENMRSIQRMVDNAVSPRRFLVILLGGFAAFAMILASLGIYAVISYSVSQRRQEIGIRMALGASASGVQTSVLLQTLRLAAIGTAIGVVASAVFAGALRSLLFGVEATDPYTFAAMLVILTMVATLAGYFPARRASRIDPIIALRSE